ncbi:hypothetical protein Goshw_011178, partial [Gossypium schwendimanii]|nr:hypothetical protein [Gossypium schwendimanii]
RGCKLDLELISVLVERWRPKTYTFHLPCDECTITLEDSIYNWGYPWMRRIRLKPKENDTLGCTSFKSSGLGVRRVGDIVSGDVSGNATNKNQNWWLPYTTTIMSQEFFVNPNTWQVKGQLIVYTTVEMYETNRVLLAHARTSPDGLSTDAHTTPIQYVPSYSGAYPNPYIFTQSQYVAPYFSTFSPMLGWTVGHPSLMFYTPGQFHFPMTPMPTTTYRPSMHEAPKESPLIIPSIYRTQYSYAHSSFVTQTP